MNSYISILRGINVSGKNKIKMADLTILYEQLGFQDVVTYIQSGNVIFKTAVNQEAELITTYRTSHRSTIWLSRPCSNSHPSGNGNGY